MPAVTLSDLARMRVSTISFFLVVFLVCAWVVRWLWNSARKDFPRLPYLTFRRAVSLVALWGLLFLLILTMISGARELMTPGAWKKEGFTYKLKSEGEASKAVVIEHEAERRAALDRLRLALWTYARHHGGAFPSGDKAPEIPEEAWRVPDPSDMRYRYTPGLTADKGETPLAYEPAIFGAGPARAFVQRQDRLHERERASIRNREGRPMSRFVWRLLIVAIAVVILTCMGLILPIELVVVLAGGWIWYLARTLPEVHVQAEGAASAIVCVILLAVGSHFFLSWLFRELNPQPDAAPSGKNRWKWRWTLSLTAAVIVMFAAGMATVGVTHQIGWLLTSKEPVVASSGWARDAARRSASANNLKQIGFGLGEYEQAHHSYPPGGTFDRLGRALQSWQTQILPYIEQESLYQANRADHAMG